MSDEEDSVALFALLACALFAGACGTDDSGQRRLARSRPRPRRRRRRRHGRAVRVLRPGGLRPAARAARRRAGGPGRQAVGAGDRARDGRHGRVQDGQGPAGTSASRTPRSTTRGARSAGRRCRRRSSSTTRSATSRASTPRRSDDKQISDIEEPRGRQLRRADRLAEHDRDADAGRRGGLRAGPGDRLRPRRQHRLPGHVHPPDRRLRLRRRRGRVPGRERRPGRQDPRAAHPAGRRRARDPLVGGQGHLRRGRPRTSSASSSPTATPPRRSRSSPTTSSARARSTASGWTPARPPSPRSRRSRTPGMEVPPITGEDQQDFLRKWKDDGLTAVAPTYPNYQWRTPIIAALKILKGEEVPKEWVLPQPTITQRQPGRLRPAGHAAAALRAVRLRGHAGLPGALAVGTSMNPLGANTWIWVSPLTDERLAELAPPLRDWGFDVARAPGRAARGLGPGARRRGAGRARARRLGGVAMAPGRELCGADARRVAATAGLPAGVPGRRRDGRGRRRSPARSTPRPGRTWRDVAGRAARAATRSCAKGSRRSATTPPSAACASRSSRSSATRPA